MIITIRVQFYTVPSTGAAKFRAVGTGHNRARRSASIAYPYEAPSWLARYAAAQVLEAKLEAKNDWYLRLVRRSSADSCVATEAWEDFHYEVFGPGPGIDWSTRFANHDAVKYDRLPASTVR